MISSPLDIVQLALYFVAILQIITLSILFSQKWASHQRALFKNYPIADYPKLYVQPVDVLEKRVSLKVALDRAIALIGLTILAAFFVFNMPLNKLSNLIIILAAVQLLPWILVGYWEKQRNDLMANTVIIAKRKSSLVARKITDFVTPIKLSSALISFIIPWCLAGFIYQTSSWEILNNKVLLLNLMNTCIAGYLVWLMFNHLYGKKKDHFIASEDRTLQIKKQCRILSTCLILYSGFISSILLMSLFTLSPLYVTVLTSLCIQIIFWLNVRTRRADDLAKDYNVYKITN